MKIAFICGCLEPGKDGVGDYTRCLAGQLTRQGNQVMIVALNDQHVPQITRERQEIEGNKISILRINTSSSFNQVVEDIKHFDPHWISLQFVPYSFQRKGLPYQLASMLSKLGTHNKWHIMFHELWVGAQQFDFKKKIYALLQKGIIGNLIKSVDPSIIHTQLPQYKQQLAALSKRKINPLPLFSNISMHHGNVLYNSNVRKFILGFFSQADVSNNVIIFIKGLKDALSKENRALEVVFIGGKGGKVHKGAAVLKAQSIIEQVTSTGFLNDQELSQALQSCHLGITSVPRHALGKSGSAAAFIEHGVPVAAPNIHPGFNNNNIGFLDDRLKDCIVLHPNLTEVEKAKAAVEAACELIKLSTVTNQFLADLNSIKVN
ncbi:hypothetical protein [Mucilaginibacter sp. PAMB04168]|uniref:hypothetical protein n=1 Tax=Mucilaginibacter sp. PAMB04168 TaxID=3138567 RepID=UPI0031F6751D